jgi:uncharacterized membrane protein YozB (DUF420 family)
LFYLDATTHALAASPQMWIMFAISIPFTLLTIAWWLIRKRHHEKRRQWTNDEETNDGKES